MIIEKGYWNYYISFQTKSYEEAISDVLNHANCITTISNQDDRLVSPLFSAEEMPELKNEQFEDLINDINTSLYEMANASRQIFHDSKTEELFFVSLAPIKIISNGKTYYCPIYVTIFKPGYCVAKLEVPLEGVDCSETFETFPLTKWFDYMEAFDVANNEYIKLLQDEEYISDFANVLFEYIDTIFEESSNNFSSKHICLDTIVINDDKNQIKECVESKSKIYNQFFHLMCPEEFGRIISKIRFDELIRDSKTEYNGINCIRGQKGRLIFYAKPDEYHAALGFDEDIDDKTRHIEQSISNTFDLSIEIALLRKYMAVDLYDYSNTTFAEHNIRRNISAYYVTRNYFEDMLEFAPLLCNRMYDEALKVVCINEDEILEKVRGLEYLESTASKRREENNSRIIGRLSLIAVLLLGLPAINETGAIIRSLFRTTVDIIPFFTVTGIAIILWLISIVLVSMEVNKINKDYESFYFKSKK